MWESKVGTCEFFEKTVPRNANIPFWLSFFIKNQNRVLKCLVSVLDKKIITLFLPLPHVVKSGPYSFSQGLFQPVWALFRPVQALFVQSRPFFTRAGPFFIQAGPFYAKWCPFSNRKTPLSPQCPVRLQWVHTINHLATLGPPFNIKGPLIQWIFIL